MTKLSTPPFKKVQRHILLYLHICCFVQQRVYQSRVHDVEELLDIGTAFNRVQLILAQVMDSASSRLRIRAKRGHFELWQYANWV